MRTNWLVSISIGVSIATVLAASVTGQSSPGTQPVPAAACARLASLNLPNTVITLAASVDAGPFTPSPSTAGGRGTGQVNVSRAFCRVAATLKPSSDSEIKIEVWLPATGWNQKFQGVGNGGFNGSIAYPAMSAALARGYATASTDTGHTGGSGSFGYQHPEKVIDFGWRAVHEMTVAAKQIVDAYYDAALRRSYWTGCSAGGRQGLQEAQRFPADYDGIVAGSPGLDWTGRAAQAVHVAQSLEQNPTGRLSPVHSELLHDAVLKACDLNDGVKDGVIEEPARCAFDPAVLLCRNPGAVGCLSAEQVRTANLLYSSQSNAKTNRAVPGLYRGSELVWTELGWSQTARTVGLEQFRFMVFQDPTWTIDKFNFATDLARAEESDANTINALNPNLQAFVDRGGKLIQYHGWSDSQISPGISTQYYQLVTDLLGGVAKIHGSYRLFMAPGMGHCTGGEGPSDFDELAALEQWVEQGQAPDRMVASHSTNRVVDRTRPLCPYPQVAVYNGTGSTNDAASFSCRVR